MPGIKFRLLLLLAFLPATLVPVAGAAAATDVEVVTSIPVETAISRAGTRDAAVVWQEMIGGARRSLDLAEFYLSSEAGQALEPVIDAVLAAGRRGVRVRILCDAGMAKTYPETLARFQGKPNIEPRFFDWRELTGGVLHAKYFVVDCREAYVGSQNFDWRALSHIHETGLRIRDTRLARELARIFQADWRHSGGDGAAYLPSAGAAPICFAPDALLVASPAEFNPPGVGSALEALLALLDKAQQRITVQLLSYSVEAPQKGGQGRFLIIDQALRRAAARGVNVRLLVSDWNLRRSQIEGLRELARVANIEVRFAVIPEAASGFIPYARVIHSKVLRVDDDVCWVGTSNWGHDYFFRSRNVEVVLRRPGVAKVLDALFLSLWAGPYAHKLEADKEYQAPGIN